MIRNKHEYSEDLFAHTRMSFGDHLDELRTRMWNAVKALLACLIFGFILDGIGSTMGWTYFGLGKPALELIKKPVEDQLNAFYDLRAWKAVDDIRGKPKNDEEEKQREEDKKKFMDECRRLRHLESSELNAPQPLRVQMSREELRNAAAAGDGEFADMTLKIPPVDLQVMLRLAGERVGKRNQLSTLSIQEMFVIYFKVTLMCGLVLACPIIFYQFWAFVGAGLYPHEKRYVHVYMPFSIGLFLAGVFLCYFWVLEGAVKALLAFNDWLGVDPDIRLKEWISLAIILPVVFGISFQTPLVMLFLSRIGMFSWEDYLKKWRIAMFVLACFAAVITPTPDAVTMLYLFVPMFALYMLGILLCKWAPQKAHETEESLADEEVAV